MNSAQSDKGKRPGRQDNPAPGGAQPGQPNPDAQRANPQENTDDEWESVEEIRHNSRTAQDREHTIRRGDDVTTQTKEFPT